MFINTEDLPVSSPSPMLGAPSPMLGAPPPMLGAAIEYHHIETLLLQLLITEAPLRGSLSSPPQINIPCPLHV